MNIAGHLDLCGPTLIEGWLFSEAWQGQAIRLQIYVASQLIGEVAVNRFRQDLQDAGYGNGNCGFSFAIPSDSGLTTLTDTRLRIVGTPVYLLPDDATSMADVHLPVVESDESTVHLEDGATSYETLAAIETGVSSYADTPPKKIERRGFSFR